MENQKQVFVIGHKNPDSDSVCSAIGYAYFKIEKAFDVVVQNGKCHIPQTLSRKKDFIPKIGYFCTTS